MADTADFDIQYFQRYIKALKEIDFELAYLAGVTCQGLKPLSRWEKILDEAGIKKLQHLGLLARQIIRTVKIGKEVTEIIFSRTPGYLQLYQNRFANSSIDKSPQTQRLEGFLFGYPACCVDQYIRQPYTPNDLLPEDQKILFHWSCKNCHITPLLLPAYKEIFNLITNY